MNQIPKYLVGVQSLSQKGRCHNESVNYNARIFEWIRGRLENFTNSMGGLNRELKPSLLLFLLLLV